MPNTALSLHQVCSHFNKYPDVLIAIIKHLHPDKLTGPIEQTKLDIPANNHVVINFVSGKTYNSLDITLDPPIKDINDGYKRILALRDEAWLALDIPLSPKVIRFVAPPFFPSAFLAALILLQGYTILTPVDAPYSSLAKLIRGTVNQLVGHWFLPATVLLLVGAHSVEAIYMYLLCNQHRVPTDVKVKWVLATLALGFPVWKEFKAESE
ncbi:hypothetical protein QFC22_001423 [Naganishia vaughanmartiniae]|uniref:Uncharacterized protein n=1 Tax=Naganishia vaughanmartiniae TaxID=1424756 RepID=A0ACC2XHW6_9TREE|nr:hypothetical protein QFC22_001423 [Naganishia vaughanmartiniae]